MMKIALGVLAVAWLALAGAAQNDAEMRRIQRRIQVAQAEASGVPAIDVATSDSTEQLIEALRWDSRSQIAAARVLAVRRSEARAALPALRQVLDKSLKPDAQRAVVLAMLAIDPYAPESVAAHHYRLCNGTVEQRRDAAMALGRFGAHSAVALRALISATRDDSVLVAREAVTALGVLGSEAASAGDVLRKLMQHADKQIAARARVALRQVGAAAKH